MTKAEHKPKVKERSEYKKIAKTLIQELEAKSIEREELSRILVLSLFAKTNVFLIGEPGIGKTYLISKLIKSVKDAKFFEYLIMHHTPPEDIFGTHIVDQKTGKMIHHYQESVLDSDFVFLDEIFKGNSTILNTLLGIANERRFYLRGYGSFTVPLISLYAASNELPQDPSLDALDDRFVIRYEVFRIKEPHNYVRYLRGEYDKSDTFSVALYKHDIEAVFNMALESIEIPDDIIDFLSMLRKELAKSRIQVSDRRINFVLNILKVSAFLNDRDYVDYSDLLILRHIMWRNFVEKKELLPLFHNTLFHNKNMIEGMIQELENNTRILKNSFENDLYPLIYKSLDISHVEYRKLYEKQISLVHKFKGLVEENRNGITYLLQEYERDRNILDQCEKNIFAYNIGYDAFEEYHVHKILDIKGELDSMYERVIKFLEHCPDVHAYVAFNPSLLSDFASMGT